VEDNLKQKLRDALSSNIYSEMQKESLLSQYRERYDSTFGDKDFDIYKYVGWRDFMLEYDYENTQRPVGKDFNVQDSRRPTFGTWR
jgi:hypothetical protein